MKTTLSLDLFLVSQWYSKRDIQIHKRWQKQLDIALETDDATFGRGFCFTNACTDSSKQGEMYSSSACYKL